MHDNVGGNLSTELRLLCFGDIEKMLAGFLEIIISVRCFPDSIRRTKEKHCLGHNTL